MSSKTALTLSARTSIILFFADMLCVWSAQVLWFQIRLNQPPILTFTSDAAWILFVVLLATFHVLGLYDLRKRTSIPGTIFKLAGGITCAAFVLIIFTYLLKVDRSQGFGRGVMLGSLATIFLATTPIHLMARAAMEKALEKLDWLFILTTKDVPFLKRDLEYHNFPGRVKILTNDPNAAPEDHWDRISDLIKSRWNLVVVSLDDSSLIQNHGSNLMTARFKGQSISDLAQFYNQAWSKVPVFFIDPLWFTSGEGFDLLSSPVQLRIKRLGDLFLSSLLLLLTWPIMLLTAVIIKIESRGPALYQQIRTGFEGDPFTIYKFRSMRTDAEKSGAQWAQQNDSRVTRIGKFIRLTRIDELPQLWNVFRGDMSFIGPRPERPEFNEMLAEKIPYYNMRNLVRPGITGWAQVIYPYGASIEDAVQKLQYDLFYIRHHSLWFDLYIVLKTISVVILGKGR